MTRILGILVVATCVAGNARAQTSPVITPVIQQTALYFISDRATIAGAGVGIGIQVAVAQPLLAQIDGNILWLNGNVVATRFAFGYRHGGTWSPAMLGTFGLLMGDKTEVLSPMGERPPPVTWIAGVRLAPLRFESEYGYVSAMELGYSVGPANGYALEMTLLSLGVRW